VGNNPRFLSVVFCCLLLSGCGIKEVTAPVSNISWQLVRIQESQGCESDSSSCVEVDLELPIFNGIDSLSGSDLNKEVVAAVTTESDGEAYSRIAERFIQDFVEFDTLDKDLAERWSMTARTEIFQARDSIISFLITTESFTGGAHPIANYRIINYNPVRRKLVRLNDFFSEEELSQILVQGEKIFRTTYDIPANSSLADAGFEFDNNRFHLPEQGGLTENSVILIFNPYEVAPYAIGPSRIEIPLKSIKKSR